MKDHGIAPIDLLVVNLYPFEATVDKGASEDDASRTSTSAARR
jgi:phosphoribosylaminoimidazolecarboxamide formyltransferase/IMP cyclohydrolase